MQSVLRADFETIVNVGERTIDGEIGKYSPVTFAVFKRAKEMRASLKNIDRRFIAKLWILSREFSRATDSISMWHKAFSKSRRKFAEKKRFHCDSVKRRSTLRFGAQCHLKIGVSENIRLNFHFYWLISLVSVPSPGRPGPGEDTAFQTWRCDEEKVNATRASRRHYFTGPSRRSGHKYRRVIPDGRV